MSVMQLLIFAIAAFCVCVGFGLAVLFEKRNKKLRGETNPTPAPVATDCSENVDTELVRELYAMMKDIAAAVDGNVDRHSSEVSEITNVLSGEIENGLDGETGKEAALVLAAANRLMQANKQLKDDLDSAKNEIQLQERQLRSYMTESRTDELTGLGNRRAFEEELRRRLAQWKRQGIPMSLVLLDVDRFKWFNDFHGHQVGDAALQQVAASLQSAAREMDVVTRYGGEEFAVVLNGTTLTDAKRASERFRSSVSDGRFTVEGNDLHLSVSAGVTEALPDETRDTILKRVDDCLYAAKNAGRNCSYSHDGKHCKPIAPDATLNDRPEESGIRSAMLPPTSGGLATLIENDAAAPVDS